MKNTRIYLSPPHLSGKETDFLLKVLGSNWIAPIGPELNVLEEEISNLVGSSNCCLLNSATSAIHLMLIMLGVKDGDYVLTQTHTHVGSVNPIVYQKSIPVFIDSEPDTWNMSPEALEEAILSLTNQGKADRIKAIMPVHLYGMPAKLDEILAIAAKYGIPVIEDAAESLGSTYKDKHTGTFGKMGVYSFNGNKIITTSGGGALVSNDKALIEKARFLATQARDKAPHYQHSEIGYNYRLSNVLAGIGRGQMQVLDERIAQRRANYQRYRDYFEDKNQQGYHIQFQEEAEGSYSNRWLTCVLIDPEKNKGLTHEKLRLALEVENIESRPLWKPMHLQPVFKDYVFFGDGTAEQLFNIGLCLPSGSNLTDIDFERIFGVLDKVFKST